MPDLSKPAPPSQDDSSSPHPDECPVHSSSTIPFPAGSPWWWFLMVGRNSFLVLGVVAPLLAAARAFLHPTATVELDRPQREVLTRVYAEHHSSVTHVRLRFTDPSFADRFMAAMPSLVFAVVFAAIAYALWRVEVNLSTTGRYTPKDTRVLALVEKWLWLGWVVVLVAEVAVAPWAGGSWLSASSHDDGAFSGKASLVILLLNGVYSAAYRIYLSGKKSWQELQEGV